MYQHSRGSALIGLQLQGWTESPSHACLSRDAIHTFGLKKSVKTTLERDGGKKCRADVTLVWKKRFCFVFLIIF